jgi:hypothetical protein
MKTIALALIAFSIALGLVSPVNALDPQAFWQQQENNGGGGS